VGKFGIGCQSRWRASLKDVFDFQDRITDSVVGIVEPSVRRWEIERSRRKRPESLDAYDLYLRALPLMATISVADAPTAAALLRDALRLDPNLAVALRTFPGATKSSSPIAVSARQTRVPGSSTRVPRPRTQWTTRQRLRSGRWSSGSSARTRALR
jgi:hypothetical protein